MNPCTNAAKMIVAQYSLKVIKRTIKLLLYISIQVDLRPLRELQLHILLTTFLGIEILRKQGHPGHVLMFIASRSMGTDKRL